MSLLRFPKTATRLLISSDILCARSLAELCEPPIRFGVNRLDEIVSTPLFADRYREQATMTEWWDVDLRAQDLIATAAERGISTTAWVDWPVEVDGELEQLATERLSDDGIESVLHTRRDSEQRPESESVFDRSQVAISDDPIALNRARVWGWSSWAYLKFGCLHSHSRDELAIFREYNPVEYVGYEKRVEGLLLIDATESIRSLSSLAALIEES